MTIAVRQFHVVQNTGSSLATAWDSTTGNPVAGNLCAMLVTAGNGVSAAESITDPSGWTPVYGTQPTKSDSPSAHRSVIQGYLRFADGSATDHPTLTVAGNSRAIAGMYELTATLGWPSLASIVEQLFTEGDGSTGQSPATGSGTAGAATSSAIVLAWLISINASQTVTWGGSLTKDDSGLIQGTNISSFAHRILTASTTFAPSASLASAGSIYQIGAFAVKELAAGSSTTRRVNVSGTSTAVSGRRVNVSGTSTTATRRVNVGGVAV